MIYRNPILNELKQSVKNVILNDSLLSKGNCLMTRIVSVKFLASFIYLKVSTIKYYWIKACSFWGGVRASVHKGMAGTGSQAQKEGE